VKRATPSPRIVVAVIPLAIACFFAAAACGSGTTHEAAAPATTTNAITLQARVHRGPWQRTLTLRLVKTSLTSFSLCAVWKAPPSPTFNCSSHTRLPEGAKLSLEQRPAAHGLKRADSPGWGMVATSEEGALEAALSNAVSGNQLGAVHYRVTLRDASDKILSQSNLFTVRWHE
jgi:hypothetical protein